MLLFAKTLYASITLWQRNDVLKFDADAILFREILRKTRDILILKRCFQTSLGRNQVKCASTAIIHVCFLALTIAGSLRRCLNTRHNGLMFKQHPRAQVSVNAWKTCVIPIIIEVRIYICL